MKEIEIPFGAKDSELKGWEYTIPEGMEAEIKDGKIVVREKESEDERVINQLITLVNSTGEVLLIPTNKVELIAWLEKQKEQKPAEWSEEDGRIIDTIVSILGQYIDYKTVSGTGSGYATPRYSKEIDWLKSLPMRCPKSSDNWKPSEDEERLINTSISFLKDFADKGYENAVECIDWLKSKLNGNSGK